MPKIGVQHYGKMEFLLSKKQKVGFIAKKIVFERQSELYPPIRVDIAVKK